MLCPRTLAVNQPGVPRRDVHHHFVFTGRVPNTGLLRCTLCGILKEHTMNAPSVDGFANYRKKELTPMRPYVPGEDMTYVSVSPGVTPELGGMIAINPRNPIDAWYVSPEYFAANYILA